MQLLVLVFHVVTATNQEQADSETTVFNHTESDGRHELSGFKDDNSYCGCVTCSSLNRHDVVIVLDALKSYEQHVENNAFLI